MKSVSRPAEEKAPVEFYELGEVQRIVGAQATPERRALFAILYGTGIEVSTALRLTRADVWDASREIRAAGTKTHTRDRVCMVAEWAWPVIAAHVKRTLPAARLFPSRVEALPSQPLAPLARSRKTEAAARLKVHAARHHWEVMRPPGRRTHRSRSGAARPLDADAHTHDLWHVRPDRRGPGVLGKAGDQGGAEAPDTLGRSAKGGAMAGYADGAVL